MVTADEVARSWRGTAHFLARRPEGLAMFETSERALWRSFAAVTLTLPALVVGVAATRHRLGLPYGGRALLDDPGLATAVALAHLAGFLLVPLLAAWWVPRRDGAAAFVIVTNWVASFGSLITAIPTALLLAGDATPALTTLFSIAFAALALETRWYATRVSLATDPITAAIVALGGFLLQSAPLLALQLLLRSP